MENASETNLFSVREMQPRSEVRGQRSEVKPKILDREIFASDLYLEPLTSTSQRVWHGANEKGISLRNPAVMFPPRDADNNRRSRKTVFEGLVRAAAHFSVVRLATNPRPSHTLLLRPLDDAIGQFPVSTRNRRARRMKHYVSRPDHSGPIKRPTEDRRFSAVERNRGL